MVHATVVQQPFQFGYESVRILAAMVRHEPSGVPENKVVEVPVKVIRRDTVQEFWDNLNNQEGRRLTFAIGPMIDFNK